MEAEAEVECPHCHCVIIIESVNCGIFRHGVVKATGEQIPPHASKEICDKLVQQDAIYGCGKPFRVTRRIDGAQLTAEVCEYI